MSERPVPEDPETPAPTHVRVDWVRHANPLRGRSLGIFAPDSPIRTKLCDFLCNPFIEPAILILILLQTILLAVDASEDIFDEESNFPGYNPRQFGHSWIDYAILGLFCIYTAEIIIHVIVSGFVLNPQEYSTINRSQGWRMALLSRARRLFALNHSDNAKDGPHSYTMGPEQPSIVRTFTMQPLLQHSQDPVMINDRRHQKRVRLGHRAFLRHSFNRLDFLAVVSYWIALVVNIIGYETSNHFHLFTMLSSLRILRLLSLTSGTSVILRSLKKAAPLLLNVALLIGFFWLLFAIIGVQSFKASLRRGCVWVDPSQNNPQNYTANANSGNFQFCGGYIDASTNQAMPWLYQDGSSSNVIKGYLCPPGNLCVEGQNPYNGTVSFDNIAQSIEMVFVTITSNTYTDIMYYLMDSEYLAAAIFFACAIVVLTLWLTNLLVAVITSSFAVIREESKSSAFAAHDVLDLEDVEEDAEMQKRRSTIRRWYAKTKWLWIAVIVYGILCQCFRSAYMSPRRGQIIDISETIVTLALLVEIIFRFASDWRNFHKSKRNLFDLFLAVVTAVIQIPAIHNSGTPYAWLTIFQILRIYRVVLAVKITRELVFLVLGSASGLLNLILFVFLLTFLVSILAVQLFRGDIAEGGTTNVTFANIFNSFLGMYQIFSSENWTAILYSITAANTEWNTAWIGAMFCILWFILGYFIVLNMFIAVIQENFDVSEDEKRFQQVKAFLQQRDIGASSNGTLSLSTVFRLGRFQGRRQDPLDYGPAMMEMLLKDAVVRDFLDDEGSEPERPHTPHSTSSGARQGYFKAIWEEIKTRVWDAEPNPFYTRFKLGDAKDEANPRKLAREVVSRADRRKKEQREYLIKYPNYNVSLFLFRPEHPLRRLCMKIVGPGRGTDRIEGPAPEPFVWYAFSVILYAAIVAMVILACITTPLYQREHFASHKNWFVYADLVFSVIFTIEAIIRVVADGLFWTPHAYFRSSWGLIDALVLITLWINVVTSLLNEGYVSRAVGAFKALRALRLLNISDSARDTFHAVIVRGGWKVLSASVVSLSLLIPFAIYGVNLFNGQLVACNDTGSNIDALANCIGEYGNTVFQWNVLSPRVASNPWYDFDNFGDSLLILFSIVSQEGWINVLWSSMAITGFFTQPSQLPAVPSQGNAVFFVVFNLLGAVFVLTLFVSVFMRNYTEQTGVAFLTTDQRSWLELRKLLRQVAPSKRPSSNKRRASWQKWCYDRAIQKSGYWQRFMTGVLVFHLIVLCSESYPEPVAWNRGRDYIFLLLTVLYLANVAIRFVGLSWHRFRKSAWDVYATIAVTGTLITTLMALSRNDNRMYDQIHKLFLVSIVLLLIPRNNQLDQLFKTAAASLTAIANLMATWFVLFLVFAIAFTQTFGLTAFGQNETDNINFRDVPKALILLFRCSTGEGWNQFMEDFANVNPPFCNVGDGFLYGDCGSTEWARALFIMWNILSMYIFVNMFVSLIYESFSYVYQRTSGLSKISRREIRRFKQAWAECDPDCKGYISKDDVPRLLGELGGVFEMRIYPQTYTIGNLIDRCRVPDKRTSALGDQKPSKEIDLDKLNKALRDLPVDEIRERRTRLNVFYEELMVSADPDKGIAFNTMLMILAHYKIINDNKSLRLEEFLRRRARLQRVEEAVRRGIVMNFFDTLYYNRKFKKHMQAKDAGRMKTVPSLQVPEIFVEGADATEEQRDSLRRTSRPALSLQIPEFGSPNVRRLPTDDRSASDIRDRAASLSVSSRASSGQSLSPGQGPSTRAHRESLGRWKSIHESRRPGNDSPYANVFASAASDEADEADEEGARRERDHSRTPSAVSAQDVMEVLDNSAWGESIRRSFTIKRGQTKRGSK